VSESFQTIAWLKQRLGAHCREVLVQGDQPLLLDDPSSVYLTLAEQHQLFCVGYENGAPRGRREHVALCRPGQLLFGMDQRGFGQTVLALSGVTGSSVWCMPAARLFGLLDEPEGERVVGQLFDAWLRLLLETLPLVPAPTRCHALAPGPMLAAETTSGGAALRAREGLLWLALREPPRVYRGLELQPGRARAGHWPISADAWLLGEPGPVRASTSTQLLSQGSGSAFAAGFYEFVVGVVEERRARLAGARLDRDRASRSAESALVADSLASLASLGRGARTPSLSEGNALERSCRTLAEHLELEVAGIGAATGGRFFDIRAALARSTKFRAREVQLEKSWFDDECGALLGLLPGAPGALEPVALLAGRKGYELHSAATSAPRRVTPELARALEPRAFQIYPTLPSQTTTALALLKFASRGSHRDVSFTLLVGLAAGCAGTLIPLLTGQVFDRIIPGAERALLRELSLVLLSTYGAMALLELARGFSFVRLQARLDTRLEAGLWDRVLKLPLPFFRRYSAGDLAARVAGVAAMRKTLAGSASALVLGGLLSSFSLGLLFCFDTRLALAAAGLVAVAVVVALSFTYASVERERRTVDLDGQLDGLIVQLFRGINKLRVSAAENRVFARWARLFARRRDAELAAERVGAHSEVFQSAFPVVALMVVFWLVVGAPRAELSTGRFLAFNAAFATLLGSVLEVIGALSNTLQVVPLYERAKPALTQALESPGPCAPVRVLGGAIELSHVSFRYEPDAPLVLDDVSLCIAPGEFVAIVGASGSGKSTLLRLLLGFESPSSGGVFYDGQSLAGTDLCAMRQQIGVVLQDSRLGAGDILSNIVGGSGLGIEAAWEAARRAALDDDIRAMPMGMHTVVSAGGGTLSGGQRQRLLIARALAKNPRLLCFDEATSALDNVTQSAVSASLEALRVTRVVIAHRLSTIERADRIVVLERGRVVEVGRFAELLQKPGVFAGLARRQLP
jgi:NHLM bacteriocin system ABC transporter ATP-binding protein